LWWLKQFAFSCADRRTSFEFLTAIRAEIHGQRQGRSWWLQRTIGVSGNATKLLGQVKFSKKAKALVFKHEIQNLNLPIGVRF
jgi:hypothetical protein